MRKRYLISYDVSDDKRRSAIFRILMNNGDHVQFSVFLCELNLVELQQVKGSLIDSMNGKQDQVIILNMGPANADLTSKLECLGKAYSPPARVLVV